LFETDTFAGLVNGFYGSIFDFAGIQDSRTLILEIFVYIGLVFTLLTIPFIEMLRRNAVKGHNVRAYGVFRVDFANNT